MFWHATMEVARKEFLQLLRTKRLLSMGIVVVLAMVLLTIVVPAAFLSQEFFGTAMGEVLATGAETNEANIAMLIFLGGLFILSGYFLLQLTPIVLTADAVCSEWGNRTVFLLLSKPVPRAAFVLGKFIGIAVPVLLFTFLLFVIDYGVLMLMFPNDSGEAIMRFFAGLGMILLGVLAYSSVALFISTLTRSTVASMLLAITMWIIVFPILGAMDLFIALARFGTDAFTMGPDEAGLGWATYLSPGETMRLASEVMVPINVPFVGGFIETNAEPWIGAITLVGHTALWLFLSVVVVQLRNFE